MAEEVFTLPAPILIGEPPQPGEQDTRITYSLSEMVKHFGRRAKPYNRTAEGARQYLRTQAAIDSPDERGRVHMLREDIAVLKALAEAPHCGWIEVFRTAGEEVPDGQGGVRIRKVKRRAELPAHLFVKLIDAIPTVAAQ